MLSLARLGLACSLLLLAGCGLKGPLYPPDERQEEVAPVSGTRRPVKRSTTPIPSPQSQKEDGQRPGSTSVPPATDTATPAPTPDPDRPAAPPTVPPRPDQTSR